MVLVCVSFTSWIVSRKIWIIEVDIKPPLKFKKEQKFWYDFEWYVKNGVQLDFTHLQERIREFNGIEISKEQYLILLKERLSTTDIKMVKKDVEPFIKHQEGLEIWSNEYFLQLADMIKFN